MEYKRLGDICEIVSGGTPKTTISEFWNGDYDWITQAELNADSYIVNSSCRKVTKLGIEKSGLNSFPVGTVMLSSRAPIGKVAIAGKEMYCNQGFKNFICNDELINKYLFWFLKGKTEYLNSLGRGATFKELSKDIIGNVKIPLPDKNMQMQIVKKLEKIKKMIMLRNQQINLLDELVRARFVEMFGDPVTNSMDWSVHQLSEYIEFLTSGSRGWAKYFSDAGEYFITIKNVKNCKILLDDVQHVIPPNNAEAYRTRVKEGDLLISITADLGRTGIVSKELEEHGGYINQHLTCIRLNKHFLVPLYVAYYMESNAGKSQFKSKNQSAVKAGLNFNSIKTLRLMVPPIELQNQFANFVTEVDKSRLRNA